jgi:hypothetical protein
LCIGERFFTAAWDITALLLERGKMMERQILRSISCVLAILLAVSLMCSGVFSAEGTQGGTGSQLVLLEEYRTRHQKLPPKDVAAHMELAAWCEQNGLKTQAESLYSTVVRLDPKNVQAHEKLGNKLVRTPKGERWLNQREQAEYQKELTAYTIPEGDTAGFYRSWERLLPLRVRMKDETVDPDKSREWPLGFTRVRKMLVVDLSLMNRTPGIVEVTKRTVFYGARPDVKQIGSRLRPGKKWNHRDEQPLLATGYGTENTVRRWRSSMRMAVYLVAEGKYGHVIRLQYLLEVPEKYEAAFRAADAKRIRKGLKVTLGKDEGPIPSGIKPSRGRVDINRRR